MEIAKTKKGTQDTPTCWVGNKRLCLWAKRYTQKYVIFGVIMRLSVAYGKPNGYRNREMYRFLRRADAMSEPSPLFVFMEINPPQK